MVPGWPYSVIVTLGTGPGSWTAPLDAVRLAPGDDAARVTSQQVRQVINRLLEAGHWRPGDPEILLVADAGYDGPASRSSWRICPWWCWSGCAPIECSAAPPPRTCRAPVGDLAATETSSSSVTTPPGANRMSPPAPTPGSTAPPWSGPGIACTHG
jgi:DDE superfamily endonuclease